jgi:ribosomal protein L35
MKVTKKGKILVRKSGGDHFNAKESRTKQLGRRKTTGFIMNNKTKSRFLPNT